MIPTEAVVYIPEEVDCDDGLDARRGVVHIERRAYRFGGVLRIWKDVLERAAAGAVVVFARQEHAARVSQWQVRREFVGEETCRLVPIIQEAAINQWSGLPAQRDRHYGVAAPFDESPTVPILDRWRAARGQGNAPNERVMRRPSRSAQLIEDAARLWGHGKPR